MFTDSIEKVSRFTRAIHSISRLYNSNEVVPGAATLFIVNKDGWALTCKHVVQLITAADQVNKKYEQFKAALQSIKGTADFETRKIELEQQFNYNELSTIQIKNTFVDCVDKLTGFTFHVHPVYDLALIKFNGFTRLGCNEFPTFQKDMSYLKQGRFLCRLGFPFPEYTNYKFNPAADDIEWTNHGMKSSPTFPIEGMITRFLGNEKGTFGIEMSVPGLRGQSGGPLFNDNAVIQGMQFATKHLHLGFDIENKEIRVNGQQKTVSDYSFIHLGHCIHVSVLKAFMNEMGVEFNEA